MRIRELITEDVRNAMNANSEFAAFVKNSMRRFFSFDWGNVEDSYDLTAALGSYDYNKDGIKNILIRSEDFGDGLILVRVRFPDTN